MEQRIVGLAIGLLNELIESGEVKMSGEIGVDTELYGGGGELDSMGLVSLVLALEQEVDSEFGVAIALADEKALSQERSPYRTVGSIAAYAAMQLSESE